ncbi:MAG: (4Fe-4S)-binding protein [Desulfobacteraceae bacterium 4572_35.1]|nr:MAG: (4Fe-4S)-binding protein [Desulfobacteraceae bacterium 4572_35.1]
MKIAIASGKGGTGKTTLSVALAQAADKNVQLIDCDVEEPNGHIFIDAQLDKHEDVTIPIPVLDKTLCNNCGKCGEICQFNAIVTIGDKTMIFDDMCHSCGGCILVCPQQALTEQQKTIGYLDSGSNTINCGQVHQLSFIKGSIKIGEAMSPPVIRAAKKKADQNQLTIIDCPPGTSCPMMTAVCDCDFVLLVTEPTPFGLHDLKLAVETMRCMDLPFAVIVNRDGCGDERVSEYCSAEKIPLVLKIKDDRRVATAYSRGEGLLSALPELAPKLRSLLDDISTWTKPATEGKQ